MDPAQQTEWELSKENIQPLKRGRKASKLANLTQPKDLGALNEERQQFETEIRMYDGEDPLDVYYRYILWVEQEYPRGGKEGNISTLIEKCIKKFKDEKMYTNDARFVDIWLKYAAISAKPLDVFNFMFNNGLCTMRPELYEAWAWYLESSKAYKKAEGVFLKGIAAVTVSELKQRLETKQKQFQARVMRRLNGEQIPEEETEEEKRSALGQLRGQGKHAKVGSVRVGAAKLGGPGVLNVGGSSSSRQPLKVNNSQAGGFKIYSDENSGAGASSSSSSGGAGSRHIPSRHDSKENEMSAGPWTKAKIVKSSHNVPLDSISQHSKPAFTVYEEPNLAQPAKTPQRRILPAENNVLSTRKHEEKWEINCRLALFEDPDPTKRPMYCKDKVYQGTTEFSFEELRALRFKERFKQEEELAQIEQRKAELVEMERKLAEQQKMMEMKMAEFQRMMTGGCVPVTQGVVITKPSVSSVSSSDDDQVSRPDTDHQQPAPESHHQNQQAPVSHDQDQHFAPMSRQPSLDTTANLLNANPLGVRNRSVSSVATPSPHAHRILSQPSPTLNTKEAMAAMQELWSKPVGEEDVEPSPLQNSAAAGGAAVPGFHIYTDNHEEDDTGPAPSSSLQQNPAFQIFCDENQPPAAAPFTIFCDENSAPAARPPPLSRKSRTDSLNRFEDKENSPPTTDDEDRENLAPAGYTQPCTGARSKTGILTQADNVEFMPLEEQEKLLDEDEKRQEQVFKSPRAGKVKTVNKPDLPRPFAGNQTIMLPDEEDFERMAKMSSTPFTGKPSYHFEQDENTCAVDILYKQCPPPPDTDMGPPPIPEPEHEEVHHQQGYNRLDTIAETSREYKSSSSSSGHETLHTNRSHWGNTGQGHSQLLVNSTRHSSAGSLARTPGQGLGHMTSVSGYLGDKSSNITKSGVKDNKRELVASPAQVQSFEKKMKILEHQEEEEENVFDEPTGMFGDMMAELKKNIVKKDLEESMQVSFLDVKQTEHDEDDFLRTPGYLRQGQGLDVTGAASRLDVTGVPRLDLTGAPRLDVTGSMPRLDLTGAPRLDITGAPRLDITEAPRLDMTTAPSLDISAMDDDHKELASRTANLSLDDNIDPFHPDTHTTLLSSLQTPVSRLHGYISHQHQTTPAIRLSSTVSLGGDVFYVSSCKGEGGYAKVFAATKQNNDMDSTISGIDAVLKVQKPANDWEFYICKQVQLRVEEEMRPGFMSIPRNYVFSDGGIFVSYHQKFGTLLDIINIVKTAQVGKSRIEPMAVYFTIEMLRLVESLHSVGIIHADLKPDNLLLQSIPDISKEAQSVEEMFGDVPLSLQLIDFGRSIDMTLLPAGTSFTKVVTTDGIMCPEMKEGAAWREHIDYFGLAAVSYCLLFQNYIEIVKIDGRWEVKGSFKRWWNQDLWRQFFGEMINIPGSDKDSLPSLRKWRTTFEKFFFEKEMAKHLKDLTNDVMKAMMTNN